MSALSRFLTPSAALVGIAAVTLAMTGCSPASTDGVATTPRTSATASSTGLTLQEVKDKGVLTVGTEGTYKPFTYHEDGGSGALTGYDVEIINAVAGKLGVKTKFEETQWDAIFAGLDAGRFDLIANQVSVTPERQAKYDFSEPYTVSPGVVIVAKSNDSIHSLADLKGKTTAQSQSSNWYQLAKDNGANVQVVEGWAQSVALLEQGRIDATVNDKLTFLDYAKTEPDKGAALKVAAQTPDVSKNAFVVPKGSDTLVSAIDEALDGLRADGTLAKISEKYFGEDVTR